jgi:hypothetical protein
MIKLGVLYKATDPRGHCYIGQRRGDGSDIGITYFGSGLLIRRAINKYGKDYFTYWLFEKNIPREKLNELEKYFIKFFNSTTKGNGYNIGLGGEGGDTFSNSSEEDKVRKRHKISEKAKIFQNTLEFKKKMSEASLISQNKPEQKEKLSKAQKIAQNRPEVIQKQKDTWHNKSKKEMDAFKKKQSDFQNRPDIKKKKSEVGGYYAHIRHHFNRGMLNLDCKFCIEQVMKECS